MKNLNTFLLLSTFVIVIINHLKLRKIMATQQQFEEVLGRIDGATNGIANTLRSLFDQIKGGGLSPDVEADVLAKLTHSAERLEGIAANPDQPVPGEETEGTEGEDSAGDTDEDDAISTEDVR